jgi:hypothetical protein
MRASLESSGTESWQWFARPAVDHRSDVADGKDARMVWRQFFRRYLVEQRLEGVVVVLVDERDPDVGIAQFIQCADSAETGG